MMRKHKRKKNCGFISCAGVNFEQRELISIAMLKLFKLLWVIFLFESFFSLLTLPVYLSCNASTGAEIIQIPGTFILFCVSYGEK